MHNQTRANTNAIQHASPGSTVASPCSESAAIRHRKGTQPLLVSLTMLMSRSAMSVYALSVATLTFGLF